jgi:hypothetical protein
MQSLLWFMDSFCSFCPELRDLILDVARFVLTHCFIKCPEISQGVFHQLIGTAMGTIFSVVYAIIHMLHVESVVVTRFQPNILLYKRFIDDGLCFWSGTDEDFHEFSNALNQVDPHIHLEWSNLSTSAVFMDLSLRLSGRKVEFEVYSKPGNAYAYLPYNSFHSKHIFSAWIKAELIRLLTHTSDCDKWIQRCRFFWTKLRRRGYNNDFLLAQFSKVKWGDRQGYLLPRCDPPQQDLRCVWSFPNTPGLSNLFQESRLNLSSLNAQIFPTELTKAVKSASRLAALLKPRK